MRLALNQPDGHGARALQLAAFITGFPIFPACGDRQEGGREGVTCLTCTCITLAQMLPETSISSAK